MTKHTILFLAANPVGTDPLALDRQAHAIQDELERSDHRDRFELVTRWAVQPLDLLRELRKLKPTVVHFSGHGGSAEPGLFFQGVDGKPQLVSTAALQQAFSAAGASVRLVVLSACFSEPQAEALLGQVDCVVGMSGRITDAAARSFAIGFYGGLGDREPVGPAFLQGCAAISLETQAGDPPRLRLRPGVDADRLVLADGVAHARGTPSSHPPRVEPAHASVPMTPDALLDQLSAILPAQFEAVVFRSHIPPGYLPGPNAPQSVRAIDLIRYFDQQGQLERLARIVQDVAPPRTGG